MRDLSIKIDDGFEFNFSNAGDLILVKDETALKQTLALLLTVDSNKLETGKEFAFNLGRFAGRKMDQPVFDEIRGHTIKRLSKLIPLQYIDAQVVIAAPNLINIYIFIKEGWHPGIDNPISMLVRLNTHSSEVTVT